MNDSESFVDTVNRNVNEIGQDQNFLKLTNSWLCEAINHNYAQNFNWLGRPIIQIPQDIYAFQELIWKVKPDLVIETGIAHGGSLVLTASMLALLDYCESSINKKSLDPFHSKRKVIGIDIDIRPHNRREIEIHPLSHLIDMIEGSSIDQKVIQIVKDKAKTYKKILVLLDSNHTHDHVLSELEAYASLVTLGSYCVVWDTGVEDLPDGFVKNRPWGKGNNPKTAVYEYLRKLELNPTLGEDGKKLFYEIDKFIQNKITITAAPDGFLVRV